MGTVLGAADFSKISFLTCMIVHSSVKHSVRFLAPRFLARWTPAKPEESSEESDENESGLLTQQEMAYLALMSSLFFVFARRTPSEPAESSEESDDEEPAESSEE